MPLNKAALKEYQHTRITSNKSALCHAPTTSMFFGIGGDVLACCMSREFPLGNIKNKTINEIWNGSIMLQMRKEMSRNQLNEACKYCVQQLNGHNFKNLHAANYDRYVDRRLKHVLRLGKRPKYPRIMEFELSNICNLECTMCNGFFSSSIRKNRENKPPLETPYGKDFALQLEEFLPHLTDAKFLGGEPFLAPVNYLIWDKIVEINPEIEVHITTNATVLNKRVKDLLNKLNVTYIVSIDSIVRETYTEIRKNADYDRVMEHVAFFRQQAAKRNKPVSFAVCPIATNRFEMPSLVEYCNHHNMTIFFNTVSYPESLALRKMNSTDLFELITQYTNNRPNPIGEYGHLNLAKFDDLLNQIKFWADQAVEREV